MRGICGWFSTTPGDDAEQTLRRMLSTSAAPDGSAILHPGPLASLAVYGATARPRVVVDDGFLLAVAGHPRASRSGTRSADLHELARSLRAGGREALADIGGDFALVTWDTRSQQGLMAVDRVGVHQLVYARQAGGLVFASTLDGLIGHPAVVRKLSSQGVFDYLYQHVSPGPRTIFDDQMRLEPGHCIAFGARGASEPQAYWSLRYTEGTGKPLPALKEEFIALLQASAREASEGADCGSFLSGGTDSSTVSGMLGRVSNRAARTFSIGFDVEGYDETEYARTAAKHFGTDHHEYYVTPADVVDSLPKMATSYDQPFGNASAIPTYHCAKFARSHGVTRLLAGDGGDELFGGNERYAKQHLLNLYQRVPAALRSGLIEPALLGSPFGGLPGVRKLRSYVEQAKPPMPRRYESYNLMLHLGAANVLTPEFLESVDIDHHRRLLETVHAPFAGASLVNQMLAIDLRFVMADGDLPKVMHMCSLADIDVTFPLFDDRLLEFSQHLPSDLKLRGTKLRWFFKEALKDFLPPAVITKKKHGFGLPVGAWLTGHRPLFDLAADSINLLRPRGIVRGEFIDELLSTKLREHPAYYGNMVWVLMVLGIWLDSRKM